MNWLAAGLGALACWLVWHMAGEAIGLVAERLTRPVRRVVMRRLARFGGDTIMRIVWPSALGLTLGGFHFLARPGLTGTVGLAVAIGAIPVAVIFHVVLRDRDTASSPPADGSDRDRDFI